MNNGAKIGEIPVSDWLFFCDLTRHKSLDHSHTALKGYISIPDWHSAGLNWAGVLSLLFLFICQLKLTACAASQQD